MFHKHFRESWFCSAQSCEAFAGHDAANSTSFYIMVREEDELLQ